MNPFCDLPMEIIEQIGVQLSPRDLHRLGLTCHYNNQIFTNNERIWFHFFPQKYKYIESIPYGRLWNWSLIYTDHSLDAAFLYYNLPFQDLSYDRIIQTVIRSPHITEETIKEMYNMKSRIVLKNAAILPSQVDFQPYIDQVQFAINMKSVEIIRRLTPINITKYLILHNILYQDNDQGIELRNIQTFCSLSDLKNLIFQYDAVKIYRKMIVSDLWPDLLLSLKLKAYKIFGYLNRPIKPKDLKGFIYTFSGYQNCLLEHLTFEQGCISEILINLKKHYVFEAAISIARHLPFTNDDCILYFRSLIDNTTTNKANKFHHITILQNISKSYRHLVEDNIDILDESQIPLIIVWTAFFKFNHDFVIYHPNLHLDHKNFISVTDSTAKFSYEHDFYNQCSILVNDVKRMKLLFLI